MKFRDYNPATDKKAIHRIWREIGWLEEEKKEEEALDMFLAGSRPVVTEMDGTPESLVATLDGSLRYLNEDLAFTGIAGVATGRIARKRGLAKRLVAHSLARDAAAGALVAGLGMFEQGYYDQLGFGTGGYEHWCSFDPAQLVVKQGRKPTVNLTSRTPQRIEKEDWMQVHAARLVRHRGHGACNLHAPQSTQADMFRDTNGFGLGYYDGPNGELTHHFWCTTDDVAHGPYQISWMTYQNREQFMELIALLKSLGDQVRSVRICEPQGIQMQDLLDQPFKMCQVSKKSKYASRITASAYWQVRICDLAGCLAKTYLNGDEVRFNLALSDPITRFLPVDAPWPGISGDYVVVLGPRSSAKQGRDDSLPILTASVGAFTRMWLGVRPATGLAITDELSGPQNLLQQIDQILRLPEPKLDWDF